MTNEGEGNVLHLQTWSYTERQECAIGMQMEIDVAIVGHN